MRRKILVGLILLISGISYSQYANGLGKVPAKVYFKNGKVKEGKARINDNNGGVAGIRIKSKNYNKEVIFFGSKGEERERVSVKDISKIEFTNPILGRLFGKTQIQVFRPIIIKKDTVFGRELKERLLYAVYTEAAFKMGAGGDAQWVYYLKNGDKYEKTTLAKIKKKYNCDMDEQGNREDKITKCVNNSTVKK